MLQKIRQLIFGQATLGLKPLPEDKRDLGFFLFGYKPKFTRRVIDNKFKPLLQSYNTCGWVGTTGEKQIDEGVELDQIAFVKLGKREGLLSGDGYSNLRDNEKVLQKFGIPEKGIIKHRQYSSWSDYSDPKDLTPESLRNALIHRSKSYQRIYTIDSIYKAIDEGRPVAVGLSWRSAFNMSRGFSWPWILDYALGWFVGGHKVYIYGYDLQYQNQKVFIARNSFGEYYGDKGDFYIKEEDLKKDMDKFGAFINSDMEVDLVKWLMPYNGKIVKGNSPDLYWIQGDVKRKIPDMATLYSWGGLDEDIIQVNNENLKMVKDGEPLNFWDGGNVKTIKAMILRTKNLKELYQKYFTELFD